MAAGGSFSIESEVTMTVNQGIAHGEILGHADESIVNSSIPVGVVFS
jgi:hypothetical protein